MSQSNLLELAKQGHPKAIESLINRQMQPKGITAKVALKNNCLNILLEAAQPPNQEALVPVIHKGVTNLGVSSIEILRIYGKRVGEELPAWDQQFKLKANLQKDVPKNLSEPSAKYTKEPILTEQVAKEQPFLDHTLAQKRISTPDNLNTFNNNRKPLRWYETDSPLLIIALLLFFFPLGLYSMWKHSKWSTKVKWQITGVIAVIWLIHSLFYKPTYTPVSYSTSSNAGSSLSSNSGKVSSEMCVNNFNRQPLPATASLNKDTKTVSIALNSSLSAISEEEFNSIAASMANSIFSSCADLFIRTVKVENSTYTAIKTRYTN
jgi:hypothetical protein